MALAAGPNATADANGKFSVDVTSLNLKKGDQITTTITDPNGYSTTFQATVQAAATTPPDNGNGGTDNGNGNGNNGGTDGNGGTNNGNGSGTNGGTTTTEDPTTTTSNTSTTGTSSNTSLPTTGDTAGLATVFGVILTTTALYVLRKRS